MIHIEPLTAGLVTARDPSLLNEGELVQTDGLIYRPFKQALSPWKARTQFGSTIGANVTGLRCTFFEGNTTTRVLIATGTVWQSGVGAGWTTVRSGLTADRRLEAIHFDDFYYCCNGVDGPVVFGGGAITVLHGMVPTEENDTLVSLVAGGGTGWQTLGLGLYFYWITEYDSNFDIESAYTSVVGGDAVNVTANTDTVRVAIQYGQAAYATLHNANATHWRVYRSSGPGELAIDSSPFPEGFLVGTVAIPGAPAITNFDDTGIVSDVPYNFLVISVAGGTPLLIQRDERPPTWSTGDIYEDSMVVNDIANKSIVRYSFPGLPHSFPSLYFVGFETKQQDEVTHIRAINEVCVVGMKTQIWRLNYLPNETDSEFQRGRCKELISANHGIMGPDAACIFTPVDGSSLLAYVSHDGLYATDGLSTQLLTDDLDWDSLVDKDSLSTAVLVNAQHLWTLLLYYRAQGSSGVNNRILFLSYHPKHLKEGGKLKVSGPALSQGGYAADYSVGGADAFKVFSSDQNVSTEDTGAITTSGTVKTRFIYPKGLQFESMVRRTQILTGSHTGVIAHSVALARRVKDTADVVDTSLAYTPPSSGNQVLSKELHGRADGFGAQIITASDTYYVAFEHETHGRD